LGDRKGIQPVKKLGIGLLVVTILLELCTSYSSTISMILATTQSRMLAFCYRLTQVALENYR